MQDFEITVQAAFGFFYLSAIVLLVLTVSKRISLSADSVQMALPSVDFLNPLPLCLFVLTFKFVVLFSNSFLMLFKVHLNLREVLYIHQIKHHTKGVLDNE